MAKRKARRTRCSKAAAIGLGLSLVAACGGQPASTATPPPTGFDLGPAPQVETGHVPAAFREIPRSALFAIAIEDFAAFDKAAGGRLLAAAERALSDPGAEEAGPLGNLGPAPSGPAAIALLEEQTMTFGVWLSDPGGVLLPALRDALSLERVHGVTGARYASVDLPIGLLEARGYAVLLLGEGHPAYADRIANIAREGALADDLQFAASSRHLPPGKMLYAYADAGALLPRVADHARPRSELLDSAEGIVFAGELRGPTLSLSAFVDVEAESLLADLRPGAATLPLTDVPIALRASVHPDLIPRIYEELTRTVKRPEQLEADVGSLLNAPTGELRSMLTGELAFLLTGEPALPDAGEELDKPLSLTLMVGTAQETKPSLMDQTPEVFFLHRDPAFVALSTEQAGVDALTSRLASKGHPPKDAILQARVEPSMLWYALLPSYYDDVAPLEIPPHLKNAEKKVARLRAIHARSAELWKTAERMDQRRVLEIMQLFGHADATLRPGDDGLSGELVLTLESESIVDLLRQIRTKRGEQAADLIPLLDEIEALEIERHELSQ